eukprot:SAG31_NODE_20762_length_566_cov_0.552463_2_plen_116_part_01
MRAIACHCVPLRAIACCATATEEDLDLQEDWANSVIGFTDLICSKKESLHTLGATRRSSTGTARSKCVGTVNSYSAKHEGKSCESVQGEVAAAGHICGSANAWCPELETWCTRASC